MSLRYLADDNKFAESKPKLIEFPYILFENTFLSFFIINFLIYFRAYLNFRIEKK